MTPAQYVAFLVSETLGRNSRVATRRFAKFLNRIGTGNTDQIEYWLKIVNVRETAADDRVVMLKELAGPKAKGVDEDTLVTEALNKYSYWFYKNNDSVSPDGIFIVQGEGLVVMKMGADNTVLYRLNADKTAWVDSNDVFVAPYVKGKRVINPQAEKDAKLLNRMNSSQTVVAHSDSFYSTPDEGAIFMNKEVDGSWTVQNKEGIERRMTFRNKDEAMNEMTRRYQRNLDVEFQRGQTEAQRTSFDNCKLGQ